MLNLPQVESLDPIFSRYIRPDSIFERVISGTVFAEGPVWIPDGNYLICSDVRTSKMYRWSKDQGQSVYRDNSYVSNGNFLDLQGRLITCEMGARRVVRTEPNGTTTILVDRYKDRRLNSPNDAVVKSDGTIWFTDPDYGIIASMVGTEMPKEQAGNYVYRLDIHSSELTIVANDFDKPNGLAFSPDESLLYIADSGRTHGEDKPHHIRVFDVVNNRHLENDRVFAIIEPYIPDGLRVAPNGDVFTSAGDGIQIFNPDGRLIGKFLTPETAANICFGGPHKDTAFICATSSVWAIRLCI